MSSSFNLDHAIAQWRRQMAAGGIQAPDVLDELESHLRDEVERQVNSGAGSQRAFEAAVDRIGQVDALKEEFAKSGPGKSLLPRRAAALLPLLLGVAFLSCWVMFGSSPALASIYCIFLSGVIVASFIDFKHFLIPDQLTLGGVLAGLVCSAVLPQMHGEKFMMAGLLRSLLGLGVGAGLVYLVLQTGKVLFGRQRIPLIAGSKIVFAEKALVLPGKHIAYDEIFSRKSDAVEVQANSVQVANRHYDHVLVRLTRDGLQIGRDKFAPRQLAQVEAVGSELTLPREAMGFGDVKFMAMIGTFLGWQAVIFSLAASSLIGSCVGLGLIGARHPEWSSRLPYGPFIATAAVIWIFGGKHFFGALFAP